MNKIITLMSLGFFLAACSGPSQSSALAQTDTAEADTIPVFQRPIAFIPQALGSHTWTITTDNDTAQNYFKQGLQMRYAYGVNDAARSFREAHLADPNCAMCYWGEAFALGSFLNGGMSKNKAPFAHEAIEHAVRLSANATELERDLIMAARERYPADYEPKKRRGVDEAFAERMKVVYEKYPGHADVAVVYAISIFLLEERRGRRDVNDPDLIHLHDVLTSVLSSNIKHPGACHLYIHATESSQSPDLALDCAEYLSAAIPIASHIQHMPSHTWNEVGFWGKSVQTNLSAVMSDQKAAKKKGFSYAPSHNLHMLLFAASMDGQGAIAMQAGRDHARLTNNSIYEVLTLLRFGRFAEIAKVSARPKGEVEGGFWDFAQGYAALHSDDVALARAYLAKVNKLAEDSDAKFRFHKAGQLMGLSAAILEGEISRHEGDMKAAIESFKRAVEFDDQQQYDEPEPIPFAARHWLGAALIQAARYDEAEKVYRAGLEDHPHNVWSLYGLKAALDAQNKSDPLVDEDFKNSTARMDVWITESRF